MIFLNIYLFLRDRETEREEGRDRERDGDTESKASSRTWAIITEAKEGLTPTDQEIMTRVKVSRSTYWPTPEPQRFYFSCVSKLFSYNYFHLFYFKFIYLFWERERKEMSWEGKRERMNLKQGPHCQCGTQHGAWTLEPWDHNLSWNPESDA